MTNSKEGITNTGSGFRPLAAERRKGFFYAFDYNLLTEHKTFLANGKIGFKFILLFGSPAAPFSGILLL